MRSVGAIGALLFALGSFGLMVMVGAEVRSDHAGELAGCAFVLGAAVLGIGWLGIGCRAGVVGSFAIPIACVAVPVTGSTGVVVLVALGVFAIAHALAPGMPTRRRVALVALLPLIVAIVTPSSSNGMVELGGLGVLGITTAWEFCAAGAGSIGMARPAMAKLFAALTAVMFVPPVLAGVFGGLALAVVVGVLSIFSGLVGMSLVIGRSEMLPKRGQILLPKARVVERD